MKKKPESSVGVELRNLEAQNRFFDELKKTPSRQIQPTNFGGEYLPQASKIIRRAFSREELVDSCSKWMRSNYTIPRTENYYANLGLLVDFVTDLFDGKIE